MASADALEVVPNAFYTRSLCLHMFGEWVRVYRVWVSGATTASSSSSSSSADTADNNLAANGALTIVRARKPHQLCTGHLQFYGREAYGVLCHDDRTPIITTGAAGVQSGYLALCAPDGSLLPQYTRIIAPPSSVYAARTRTCVDLATYLSAEPDTLIELVQIACVNGRSVYTMATPATAHALTAETKTVHVLRRVPAGTFDSDTDTDTDTDADAGETAKKRRSKYDDCYVPVRTRRPCSGEHYLETTDVTQQAMVLPPWDLHAGRIVESWSIIKSAVAPGTSSLVEHIQSAAPLQQGKYYACALAGKLCKIFVEEQVHKTVYKVRRLL